MTRWFDTLGRFKDPVGAARIGQFVDVLSRFPAGTLIDLGAGHGIFSRAASDLGWTVRAVDARTVRFPDEPGVTWIESDVRDFDDFGDADVVACLGLWYHLTADDQVALAKKIAPRPLILDTHVALEEVPAYHRGSPRISTTIETRAGHHGRLYDENGLEDRATASWGNAVSFWPTVASLESQLYDAGYDIVEQHSPPFLADRAFFLARTVGTPEVEQRLDEIVGRYDPPVDEPPAPAPRPRATLAARLEPAAAAPVETPAPAPAAAAPEPTSPLPLAVATRQLGVAVRASARRRIRLARRFVDRQRKGSR